MKKTMSVGAALLLSTSAAFAGGLDRSGQPIGIIFEDGNVAQLSFGSVSPDVSGVANGTGLGNVESGNMAPNYTQFGLGLKYDFNEQISLALIFDQPYGADVDYGDAQTGYYTGPATADVDSSALTALARYRIDNIFSVYGGLKYQTVSASVSKPTAAGYSIESEDSSATGFVAGVAYERPDIALRVALTYHSKVEHDITNTESCPGAPAAAQAACTTNTTTVETPEAINLDFQSGIAQDTLLFGSIRHAKWTQFDFAPPGHAALGLGSLQSYDNDTTAYSLGVGRRFSDEWSGAVSVGFEDATGGFAGNLSPTDGNTSLGLGATYTGEGFKVTGGARYIWLGDADTEHPVAALAGTTGSEFRDNTAIATGLSIVYSF